MPVLALWCQNLSTSITVLFGFASFAGCCLGSFVATFNTFGLQLLTHLSHKIHMLSLTLLWSFTDCSTSIYMGQALLHALQLVHWSAATGVIFSNEYGAIKLEIVINGHNVLQ